jgi:hypothetical protein
VLCNYLGEFSNIIGREWRFSDSPLQAKVYVERFAPIPKLSLVLHRSENETSKTRHNRYSRHRLENITSGSGPYWNFSQVSVHQPVAPIEVGSVDDPLEREADGVADRVLRTPPRGAALPSAPTAGRGRADIINDGLRSQGQPLDPATRAFFEPRFGANFCAVRVHTDQAAAASATALRARAYTLGGHIVFGPGEYAPSSEAGRRLVAHELAHTLQQSAGQSNVIRRQPLGSTADMHQWLENRFEQQHGRPAQGGAHGTEYARWLEQSSYDAAVALLQPRNARLYGYLRQGRVGQTVLVRTERLPIQGGGPASPTTLEFRFNLELVSGGVQTGAVAQFQTQQPTVQLTAPTATATLHMPMNFTTPGGPNASLSLAEYLYHEGIHMLLAMDRLIESLAPGSTGLQSGMHAAVEAYRTRVRGSHVYNVLAVDLEVVIGAFMTQHGQAQTASYYRDASERVINGVIDERFAVDQQRRQFPGNPVANLTIADAYIPNELLNEGIILSNSADLARLKREMTAVLDLIP